MQLDWSQTACKSQVSVLDYYLQTLDLHYFHDYAEEEMPYGSLLYHWGISWIPCLSPGRLRILTLLSSSGTFDARISFSLMSICVASETCSVLKM